MVGQGQPAGGGMRTSNINKSCCSNKNKLHDHLMINYHESEKN